MTQLADPWNLYGRRSQRRGVGHFADGRGEPDFCERGLPISDRRTGKGRRSKIEASPLRMQVRFQTAIFAGQLS